MRGTLWALMVLFMIGLAVAKPEKAQAQSAKKRKGGSAFTLSKKKAVSEEPMTTATSLSATASTSQTTAAKSIRPEIMPIADKSLGQQVIVRPSKEGQAVDLNTTIPLGLNNVQLDMLIRFIAETTGKTVIKQRDLNAVISVNAPKPVSKRQALDLIYSELQLENIFVAEQDNIIQLINFNSLKNIKLENIPATVDIQQLSDSMRIVRKFYSFKNIQADDVRRHLEVFQPNLSITVEPRSNTMIITDQLTRIKSYDQIIKTLDTVATPDDKVIEVYKLTGSSAADLSQLLRLMISSGALTETTGTQALTHEVEEVTSGTLPVGPRPGDGVVIRPVINSKGGSEITLIPDAARNWIIALCPKSQKAALDRLITEFDTGKSDDRLVQIYKLKNTDPGTIINLLNTIINNKGLNSAAAALSSGKGGAAAAALAGSDGHKHGPAYWKRMAASMGGATTAQAGDIVLLPEMRQNWIIAIMRPDLKSQIDTLINQFDVTKERNVQVRMLDLKGGNAVMLASTIQRLLSDMPMSGPSDYIRVTPAEDGARLIVTSSEANFKVVEDLVKTVGTVSNDRTMEIFKLKNASASQIIVLINAIIANKGLGKLSAVNVGGASSGVHGSKYWKRMAESGNTGFDSSPSASRVGQVSDVMLMPESRLNWIIAIMKPEVKDDVAELIKEFDVVRDQGVKFHMVDVAPGKASQTYYIIYRMFNNMITSSPSGDTFYIYPADDNAHILLISSDNTLKLIQDAIKSMGSEPGKQVVQVYPLKNADCYLVCNLIVSVLPTRGFTARFYSPGSDVTLIYDQRNNWIVATMKPEAKADVDSLVQQFDVPKTQDLKLRTLALKSGNAAKMAATLTNMLALQPINSSRDIIRVMAADDSTSKLLVMSSEANYKVVQDLIDTIGDVPTNRIVEIYQLTNADAPSIMSMVNSILSSRGVATSAGAAAYSPSSSGGGYRSYYRRMAEMASSGGGGGSASGDLMMIPDIRLNWIIAIMKPDLKKDVDALIKQFDVAKAKEVQVRMIDLKGGNATTLAATLNKIVSDQPVNTPADYMRIMPADDNVRLIVVSNEANYKMIQGLIDTIGTVPNNRTVEIYKLVNAEASALVSLINSVVSSRGLGTTSAAAGAPSFSGGDRSSYRSFYRRMAEMGAGAGGSSSDLMLIPETRLNWIIAIMKPELKTEVDNLVKEFDVVKTKAIQARTIDLQGGNATNMAATLNKLIATPQQQSGDPNDFINIVPAEDNVRLIVMSNEGNFQVIQDLIKTVGVTKTNRVVETYKLVNAESTSLISIINSVITSRGLGTTSAAAGAPMPSSSSSGSFRSSFMRRMADAMAASSGGQAADVMLIPETRLNWVVAIMKPELKKDVDALVQQFDVIKTKAIQAHIIDLKGGNATNMAATLNKLISTPQQSPDPNDFINIVPAEDNVRLIVMSNEGNFQVIQDLIKTVGITKTNRVVETYKLVNAESTSLISIINSVITSRGLGTTSAASGAPAPSSSSSSSSGGMRSYFMRRMAEAMAASGGQAADVMLIPETRLNWVVAIMKPELKKDVDALVAQFDVIKTKAIQAHMIDLKGGNATNMAATLNKLIAGTQQQSTDPNDFINIVPADDNARLIVMSNEGNFQVVQDLIKTVGISKTNRVVETYKLTYADANSIISIINTVITNRGLGTTSAAPATAMPMSSSSSSGGSFRSSFMRRMADAMAASSGGQAADVMLVPETRLNWVVAIVKPELKKDIDELIKQFDVEKVRSIQARTIDLKNGNGASIANTVTQLLAGMMMQQSSTGSRSGMSAVADPSDYTKITATDDNSHLIVMSTEANYKLIQDLVNTVSSIPNNRIVETYKLTYADPATIASTINSIITSKGIGSASVSNAPASSGSAFSGGYGGGGSSMRSFFMRRMADAMASAGSNGQSADLLFLPDSRLNWLVAIMKPELKKDVDELVKQFDVDNSKDVTARTILVKNSTAQSLAMTLNNLIQGQLTNSNNPRDMIRITAADDNARVIVMSTEANFKLVQGLVDTLDNIPDDRVVDIYKLTYADASELTNLLNTVISQSPLMKTAAGATAASGNSAARGALSRSGLSGGSSSGGYSGRSSSGGYSGGSSSGGAYGRYSRYFGGSGGSSRGGYSGYSGGAYAGNFGGLASAAGAVQAGAITLIPETRLNWIITVCPKELKTELDKMVKQFDIEKPKDIQARVIDVKHVSANSLAINLNQMLMQQSSEGRREYVRVTAMDDDMRLLVWSTEANFKDIQEMVKTLDVEVTKDVQARMIEVKYAEATNLATTINNIFRDTTMSGGRGGYSSYGGYGGYGGGGSQSKEYVRVSATDDGNRLMVMSSEANYKIIQDLLKQLDTPESESQVTRVFKIEHLEAQALAQQLTTLFQERARTQTANMFSNSYFGYYGGGGRNSGSGQIPVPSIVPSPRTNTIMVMARPKDVPFIEQMVKELDVPINPEQFEPRIYRIRNTDANEVVTVLQNLFEGRGGASGSRTTNINYYLNSWRPNSGGQGGDAIAQVFGQIRFVVDRMTNTIVALSSNTKNYEIIDAVIQKIDSPDPDNSEVMVYDLKYAEALKVADQMNYLFSEGSVQRAPTTQQPQRTTTSGGNGNNNNNSGIEDQVNSLQDEVERDFVPLWGTNPNSRAGETERPINSMIGKVRVVPDTRSNKLMVAAPPVYFTTLTKLVESLDHAEPQVYITTRILEITRGNEKHIGLRWTPDPTQIDPSEMDNAVLALNQLGFLDTFGHGDQIDPTKPTGATITQTVTGIAGGGNVAGGMTNTVARTLKNGNSVISSNVNIALLVQLLLKNSQSRVFTEPGVTVNNNELGNIFFGSEYPFRVNTTMNLNGNNQTVGINYRPVGINLDIKPHINSMDEVVLKIAGENSNVRAEMIDGQIIKDMRRFTTEVSLKSGETIVIGGIMIDDGQKTRRGVPILGSIPVLKYIFGKTDNTQNMRELVFFVTPEVINTSQDTQHILNKTNERINAMDSLNPKKLDDFKKFEELANNPPPRKPAVHQTIKADLPAEIIRADLPEVPDERPNGVPKATVVIDQDKNPVLVPVNPGVTRGDTLPQKATKRKPVVIGKSVDSSKKEATGKSGEKSDQKSAN